MIIRTEKTKDFSTIANAAAADTRLSLKAKGLFYFLMTKPDEWEITERGLSSVLSEGRTAIRSALKELELAGFLHREKTRTPDGTFKYEAVLVESPVAGKPNHGANRGSDSEESMVRFSVAGKSVAGKPNRIVNTDKVNTDKDITDVIGQRPGSPEINDMFDFWDEQTGMPIQARVLANRRACSNLLKKHGAEKLRQLIKGVALTYGDRYAPKISDFCSLQQKIGDLLVWGRQQSAKPKGVKIR